MSKGVDYGDSWERLCLVRISSGDDMEIGVRWRMVLMKTVQFHERDSTRFDGLGSCGGLRSISQLFIDGQNRYLEFHENYSPSQSMFGLARFDGSSCLSIKGPIHSTTTSPKSHKLTFIW